MNSINFSEVSNRSSLDILLLPPESPTEIDLAVKKITQSSIDDSVISNPDLVLNELDDLKEQYGSMTDLNTAAVDYNGLFSYLEHQVNILDKYDGVNEEKSPSSSAAFSEEEAKRTVEKIQLSYLTGNKSNITADERERFSTWQMFNTSLLMLYHQLSPVRSGDVDYSRLN